MVGFETDLTQCALPLSYRHTGASNEYLPVPIGPAVRAPEAKVLGHTCKHTNTAQSPAEGLGVANNPLKVTSDIDVFYDFI